MVATTKYRGNAEFDGTVAFDGAVDFDAAVDATGGTLNVGARTVAADGALAISGSDNVIILLSSTTGTKAATITAPTTVAAGGSRLKVILKARSGGSYTIACTNASTAGTLTLDAAGEGAELCWINGTLHVVDLIGTASHA